MQRERYTLTYRAAEAHQVMAWIKAGQSGCLIGLRGAGKSNLLCFLLREDVRRHYLGQDYADFVFVPVDLLALVERAEWAIYELMLDRLLGQLHPLGMEEGTVDEMTSLHREVVRARDSLIAQRAVERCVDVLCQRPARVVLLFDEFDVVFRSLDPSLFRCLRAVRDAHKDQVSYVIVVADDLACLRDDLSEMDHFYRLVNRNVCHLGPLSEGDARQMIHHLAARWSIGLSAKDTTGLIELSGGHAGLLKAILSLLWDVYQDSGLTEIAPILEDEATVQAECRRVWASLSEGEQAALCTLVSGTQVDPHTFHRLKRNGLVREGQLKTSLFSPLFADFVRRQSPPPAQGTVISRSSRVAQIDGRRVETLSELEFETLCYLYERQGQVCTKDELIENVYRQQYETMRGGVTDEALQQLISRLRGKIEPDRKWPRYVVTIRGQGYKFVQPREW